MAAYDLVLAKMKSVGAASVPVQGSAKLNKKKRKQPEPSALPAIVTAAQGTTDQDTDAASSKKKKKRKAKAAADVTDNQTQSTAQAVVAPKAVALSNTVQQLAPAQAPRARGRHVGRYHKTTAAKKAGSYSKSDLAAILGVDSFPSAIVMPSVAAAQPSSSADQVSLLGIYFPVLDCATLSCTLLHLCILCHNSMRRLAMYTLWSIMHMNEARASYLKFLLFSMLHAT